MNAMICRNCGAGLEADNIDSSLGVVTCAHCGGLHSIPGAKLDTRADYSTAGQDKDSVRAKRTKPENINITLPSRFKVQRSDSSMEVTWAAGRVFHGIVLTIMAVGVIHAALSSGTPLLLLLSAALFYYALVRVFNKHCIRVDSARLQVTQGPLPWPGARKLDSRDVKQLFATEHKTKVENSDKRTRIRKYYRLSANTHGDGRVTILNGLGDPLQVLWLEQEIERLLGISDKQVTGEYAS